MYNVTEYYYSYMSYHKIYNHYWTYNKHNYYGQANGYSSRNSRKHQRIMGSCMLSGSQVYIQEQPFRLFELLQRTSKDVQIKNSDVCMCCNSRNLPGRYTVKLGNEHWVTKLWIIKIVITLQYVCSQCKSMGPH